MNKKGFTLVELLATLVILGLVMAITFASISGIIKSGKEKSEEAFAKTIEDAINVYLDSDAKSLVEDKIFCRCIKKTHGEVAIVKMKHSSPGGYPTFNDVIQSNYKPILLSELVNPADKEKECSPNGNLDIYRDDDYVYYYNISKDSFGCFNTSTGNIANLPTISDCEDKRLCDKHK